eukprot:4967843-Pleurochrysis_carterae.AAC.2
MHTRTHLRDVRAAPTLRVRVRQIAAHALAAHALAPKSARPSSTVFVRADFGAKSCAASGAFL